MLFTPYYLRSSRASWKSKISMLYVIQECERWIGMVFSFSLGAISLLVTLVVYFGMRLGDLAGRKLLEGGEVCYCQYWKFEY